MFVYFNEIFSFPDAVNGKKVYTKEEIQRFQNLDDNFWRKFMHLFKIKK